MGEEEGEGEREGGEKCMEGGVKWQTLSQD